MTPTTFVATDWQGLEIATRKDDGTWTIVPRLTDQTITCLAVDPLNRTTVYAGTLDGVLCSADRGTTWQRAGLEGHRVKSLCVSPLELGTVYAGTKPPGLFVSHDGGAHWDDVPAFRRIPGRWFWFSPAEPPSITPYVQGIALSPTDPKVILAGIEAGAVVRSDDGGQTWSGHRRGAVRDCHSLTFHATDGNYVYEGGGGGAAFSNDGGRSWLQPRDGLPVRYGWACAADPAQPDTWYASLSPMPSWKKPGPPPAHIDGQANAHIYRFRAGRWQVLSGGLPEPLNYMAYALLTDPAHPDHVYAGLASGDVWHSADHGDTWQKLPFAFKAVHRVMVML